MDSLEEKYALAEKASQDHLRRLDRISSDIKRLESFLKGSGFTWFSKRYSQKIIEDIYLTWNGSRLWESGTPLIETKVAIRMRAHQFLADFLESISVYHMNLGGNHETD